MLLFQGLPVLGVDHVEPGLYQVPSLSVRGTVYCPAYIQVEQIPDSQNTEIVRVGMQTHLMEKV